jgi:hypothetical protein
VAEAFRTETRDGNDAVKAALSFRHASAVRRVLCYFVEEMMPPSAKFSAVEACPACTRSVEQAAQDSYFAIFIDEPRRGFSQEVDRPRSKEYRPSRARFGPRREAVVADDFPTRAMKGFPSHRTF